MGSKVQIIILCLIILTLLYGCQKSDSGVNSSGSIEYASMWNTWEPQADYLRKMAADFEKETGVHVEILPIGRNVLTKVKSRLLMGDPPDLVDQDFNELAAAISANSMEAIDLGGMLYNESNPEGKERLIDIFGEKLVRLYEKEGKSYFFPYEFITSGFFYDKSLFKKYDMSVPDTWEEFMKNNDLLISHNIRPLAADGNINFYNAYYFSWAVERILGPGALKRAAEDRSGKTWNDPGYMEAARMVYELSKSRKNYFQEGYDRSEWPTAQIEWAGGKYGNILCATWVPLETQEYVKGGFDYGFYPFPEVEGGKGKITDIEVGFIGCAIPKGAKNVDNAKAFLRFLVRKENAQKFCDMTHTISARNDVGYPSILTHVDGYIKDMVTPYKSYDGVWADLPEWWANVFLELNDKLIFGNITPTEFIQKVKQDSMAFWATKKQSE